MAAAWADTMVTGCAEVVVGAATTHWVVVLAGTTATEHMVAMISMTVVC